MTVAQYNEIVQRLKTAGAGHPKGRRYHACFGEPDKLQVFDVWDSQAAFDAFGQTLMPILTEMGANTAQPVVMPVHSVMPFSRYAADATSEQKSRDGSA